MADFSLHRILTAVLSFAASFSARVTNYYKMLLVLWLLLVCFFQCPNRGQSFSCPGGWVLVLAVFLNVSTSFSSVWLFPLKPKHVWSWCRSPPLPNMALPVNPATCQHPVPKSLLMFIFVNQPRPTPLNHQRCEIFLKDIFRCNWNWCRVYF